MIFRMSLGPYSLLLSCLLCSAGHSQSLNFTSVPQGYLPGSIQLPRSFTGALAVDPDQDHVVYASIGNFQDVDLARIDLSDRSVETVADGPFGNIGGIAVLSATQLVLVDNSDVTGPPPGNTILLAQDLNQDGDFNDSAEIEELIAPILIGPFGWSGVQALTVPPGNPSGIPSGSVIVQTADGNGEAELLVIEDPLGAPAYRPTGGSFFSGFDFNGGLDFDSKGRLMMGTAVVVDATLFDLDGRVIALVNSNGDEDIDPGESNVIVNTGDLPNSKSDLAIDGEDEVYCTSGGEVETFPIPADPLNQTAAPTSFAISDSGFLSGILINSKIRPFEPFSGPGGATMIIGDGFGTLNLLTLTPLGSADLNGDGIIDARDLLILQGQWMESTR